MLPYHAESQRELAVGPDVGRVRSASHRLSGWSKWGYNGIFLVL